LKRASFYLFLLASCGGGEAVFAQTNLYPAYYAQASEVNRYFNPALANRDLKLGLELGNQFYSGVYSKIENHYLLANINLGRQDSLSKRHNLGVKISTEKEGEYISRPKGYLSYALHVRLSELYYASAGVNVGMAGYVYKSTNISGGGAATVPDADLGLAFYSERFVLGLSVNQVFDNKLLPRDLYFRWRRFCVAYLEKMFPLGQSLLVRAYAQKMFLSELRDRNDFGLGLLIGEHVEIGVTECWQERISFRATLRQIEIERMVLQLLLAYNLPHTSASQANNQSFEVVLGVGFR
jgi:hypothetical protein